MRRLPDGFDGNQCPYVFTWSDEIPNKTWGMGSGCSAYYNTEKEGNANTHMVRYFDEDRFEIFATRKQIKLSNDEAVQVQICPLALLVCNAALPRLLVSHN